MTGNNEVLATGGLSPDEAKQLEIDINQDIIGKFVMVQQEPCGNNVYVSIASNDTLILSVVYNLLSLFLRQQCNSVEVDGERGKYGWGLVIKMNLELGKNLFKIIPV